VSAADTSRSGGFTLLEMLAVIALTALVLTAAADYYVDLSRAGSEAVEKIQGTRRAARLLDRLARELEGSVLVVKPPELDPIRHPWLFLAEADDQSQGAQRVKFVTRSHRPPSDTLREQDLAVVSYVAEDDGDGGIVLWRTASPHLPEELDLSFPREQDGAQILSEDLAAFGLLFLTEEGEWVARFDSSTLLQSGQLPRAAEIELAFLEQDDLGDWVEGPRYRRRVVLPLRALDIQAELEAAGLAGGGGNDGNDEDGEDGDGGGDQGEEDNGEGGLTVGECASKYPDKLAKLPPPQRAIIDSRWDDAVSSVPTELLGLAEGYGIFCP
jgi:prepilin-type N-terminal cleavage/methylation domain-containing protein